MASADGAKRKRAGRASRRPPRSETTLACFIQALQGRRVVVELRNDVIIRGCLEEADDFMNLTMAQVVYQTINGYKTQYESLYIKGRNVRFVHLPRALDPAQLLEAQRAKLEAARIAEYKARQQLARLSKGEPSGHEHQPPSGGEGGGPEDSRGGGDAG